MLELYITFDDCDRKSSRLWKKLAIFVKERTQICLKLHLSNSETTIPQLFTVIATRLCAGVKQKLNLLIVKTIFELIQHNPVMD